MGNRLTKSHHVLYFPRLGNKRTSRSLQAGYRLVLDLFPQHHFVWNTNLPLCPTVVSMNEWLLFSLASLVALFLFSTFCLEPLFSEHVEMQDVELHSVCIICGAMLHVPGWSPFRIPLQNGWGSCAIQVGFSQHFGGFPLLIIHVVDLYVLMVEWCWM